MADGNGKTCCGPGYSSPQEAMQAEREKLERERQEQSQTELPPFSPPDPSDASAGIGVRGIFERVGAAEWDDLRDKFAYPGKAEAAE